MKSKVAFHPLVESDAADAAEWYERQCPGRGAHFVSENRERLQNLPREALLYAVRFRDIRRVNLPAYLMASFFCE